MRTVSKSFATDTTTGFTILGGVSGSEGAIFEAVNCISVFKLYNLMTEIQNWQQKLRNCKQPSNMARVTSNLLKDWLSRVLLVTPTSM